METLNKDVPYKDSLQVRASLVLSHLPHPWEALKEAAEFEVEGSGVHSRLAENDSS
jgi:hypothetical protein